MLFSEYILRMGIKYNNGHAFERQVAQALLELNNSVFDLHLLQAPESEFSISDRNVINTIKNIFKTEPSRIYRVANPNLDNADGYASDFIADGFGLSCKLNTKVLKAPSTGSIYKKATGRILRDEIMLDLRDVKANDRESFLNLVNMNRKQLYASIGKQEYELLVKENITTEIVKKLYFFLMGRENPWILVKGKKNIDVYRLNKLPPPESMSITFIDDKLRFNFDNGITLQKRFKTAKSSKDSGYWFTLFKEEWSIVSSPAWDSIRETFAIDPIQHCLIPEQIFNIGTIFDEAKIFR